MNLDRLQRFQTGTLIALVGYLLLLLYMVLVGVPTSNPMWNSGMAERQIQQATTMPELQSGLRDAVGNLTWGLHLKNRLLLTFIISTVVLIGYLGWSLLTIRRMKREDSINHAD
jgi:hypothetical protein